MKYSDMPTEMGAETVEIITMAVDKFQGTKNYEVSTTLFIEKSLARFMAYLRFTLLL